MKKKSKPVDDTYRIYSSIKRSFSKSQIYKQVLQEAKHPTITGPRGGARYICSVCGKDFGLKEVQVDHIIPVVPLGVLMRHLTPCNIVNRTYYCGRDNLQCICDSCHKDKSKIENAERKKIKNVLSRLGMVARLDVSLSPCGKLNDTKRESRASRKRVPNPDSSR